MKRLSASLFSAANGRIHVTSNVVNATYNKKYANVSFKSPVQAAIYVASLDKSLDAVIVSIGTGYSIFVNR